MCPGHRFCCFVFYRWGWTFFFLYHSLQSHTAGASLELALFELWANECSVWTHHPQLNVFQRDVVYQPWQQGWHCFHLLSLSACVFLCVFLCVSSWRNVVLAAPHVAGTTTISTLGSLWRMHCMMHECIALCKSPVGLHVLMLWSYFWIIPRHEWFLLKQFYNIPSDFIVCALDSLCRAFLSTVYGAEWSKKTLWLSSLVDCQCFSLNETEFAILLFTCVVYLFTVFKIVLLL